MKRKGITPVIAIVLLLLITVGAVGVVYTQFEALTNTNPQDKVANQQKVQNTRISINSLYKDTSDSSGSETINMTIENVGSETVNVTKQFELMASKESGDSTLPFGTFNRTTTGNVAAGEKDCFEYTSSTSQERAVLEENGDTYNCDTGIYFPSPSESVWIGVSFAGAEKSFGPEQCSVDSTDSVSCY